MHTFTPPTNSALVPPFLPDSTWQQKRLFQKMKSRPQGVNVFLLSDGTVVQDYPSDTPVAITSQGAVPYPWNPSYPNAPYVSYTDGFGVQQYITQSVYITAAFYGGHGSYPITAAQYTQLSNAGYGPCLT